METTTNTKNDIKNIDTKMQSKNNNNGRNKQKIKRDITALEKSAEALKSLEVTSNIEEVKDKNFIQHNLNLILELKAKGVGYATIHQKLVETVGLRISIGTMKLYIQQYKDKMGLVERRSKNGSKRIQVSIPKEFEAGLFELVEQINAAPTQQVHIAGVEMTDGGPPKVNWELWFNKPVAQTSIN